MRHLDQELEPVDRHGGVVGVFVHRPQSIAVQPEVFCLQREPPCGGRAARGGMCASARTAQQG